MERSQNLLKVKDSSKGIGNPGKGIRIMVKDKNSGKKPESVKG